MIKCPYCQTPHVENTLFCSECGNYLLQGDARTTDPLGFNEVNWKGEPGSETEADQSLEPGTGPMTLRLIIGEHQREVQVVLNKVIHLGRLDPASNIFPEVDLSPDGSQAQGVSRRHVGIFKQGAGVMIEDLGSSNGTFVNGKRLDPYFPEPLKHGDLLQLGRLLIKVGLGEQ
ncbi:MAG: FHA domain-containing protein [Anaerolineales bacterium]|nr:FHA domain-containing protein [Anaerolineales bacterium]